MRILLAGVSARAAAASAARAGFEVTAIDAFADLDQHPAVHTLRPPQAFTVHGAARMALSLDYDAAVYLANFENYPRAVALLDRVWGNPPEVLRRVRNPVLLTEVLGERGFATPAVFVASRPPAREMRSRSWLLKRRASGGGHRVRRWRPGDPVPRGSYVQERVEGTPCSIAFVAAGGRAVPLGVFRQLIGESDFGASGFRYCGNILAAPSDREFGVAMLEEAGAMASVLAESFDLVGVNGIDFIVHDGVPQAIEVNPRWTGAMELVEQAYGLSVFGAHAAACRAGELPDFDLRSVRQRLSRAVGKAVIFSRHDVAVGDTRSWLNEGGRDAVRDVPRPGQRIPLGGPVCTVFATGPDMAACRAALVTRAERVYARLAGWTLPGG